MSREQKPIPRGELHDAPMISRRSLLRGASGAAMFGFTVSGVAAEKTAAAATGYRGGVATGNGAATRAGLEMLTAGGNAADAAASSLLVLSICDPSGRELFCFGGEVPILIYDPQHKKVEVLAGQGAAPRLATRKHFDAIGGIPRSGVQAAAVPAVLDACVTLLTRHGTKSFSETAGATMAELEAGGEAWQQHLLQNFKLMCAAESATRGERSEKLAAVADTFYRGEIARRLDTWSRQNQGLLRYEDLAAHRTRIESPLSTSFADHTICKCGPWTQGPYLLQTLQLLAADGKYLYRRDDPQSIHTLTEAMKLALADRDAYYADPLFAEVPLKQLFSDEYVALRGPLIDPARASLQLRPGDPRAMRPLLAGYRWDAGTKRPVMDTTNCVTADDAGQMVVATPSGWAGALAGETGIRLGSRLQSFNTWPGHPNCIAPGKRPRITLTPTLILREGKPVAGISVAGGDWQDQVALQLLLAHLIAGEAPREATAAPRYGTRHLIGSFGQPGPQLGNLTIDPRLGHVAEPLRQRGHKIEVTRGPIGAPCMVSVDSQSGRIDVAGDPGTGRVAMAH